MTVLEYLAANPDCRLTFWATIEGLDQMLTQVDGPTDPGDYLAVQQILEPFPLSTNQGIDSLLTGNPVSSAVTLKLCDHGGWFRSLLQDTTTTSLYSPVERGDTTISVRTVDGLTAPGVIYLGRERIEFNDYSDEGTHWDLLDCVRSTFSDGYDGRYPANDEGVFPVYPVGLTPGRLEGRYVRIYAMPLDPDGGFLFAQNDAQEIWRGVIDSVPISVDGVLWDVQCKGLESLLNQQVRNENQGTALVVQPAWEPNAGRMMLIQPDALFRVRVRRETWQWTGDPEFVDGVTSDWINCPILEGNQLVLGPAGIRALGYEIASNIYANDPDTWPEFDTDSTDVRWEFKLSDDGSVIFRVTGLTDHWPAATETLGADDPLQFRYQFWVDHTSDLVRRYGLQEQFALPLESEQVAINTATLNPYIKTETQEGDNWQRMDGTDWETGAIENLLVGTGPAKMVHISEDRDRFWVLFPSASPWTRPGHCEVGDELVTIDELSASGWAMPGGPRVYELAVQREASPAPRWSLSLGFEENSEPVEITPALVIAGPDPFACTAGLLMGIHEDSGNGPYSEAIGAGIYSCHCDLPEFARLLEQVAITGGRRAVYDDDVRLQDWIGQNLALEEVAIVPGFVGTEYKLRPVRISTAPAVVHTVRPDWQGALRVQSGLGRVVNVVQVTVDKGRGTYRDLDSAAKYAVTRTQTYDLARISSADGLANLGPAAARLFSLFGHPTILLSLPLAATGRTIEPGHGIIIETPNLPALYTVLSAQRTWANGREHCILQLQEIPEIDAGFYAPVAKITGVDGKTAEIGTTYTQGLNPFTGATSRAVDYFQVGDGVVMFDPGDQETEVDDTIAAIDLDLETITLTTNNVAMNQCITLRTRATATTQSAARYIFVDGLNDWI